MGYFPDGLYHDEEARRVVAALRNTADTTDAFAPTIYTLREQAGLGATLDLYDYLTGALLVIFIIVMSIVLWNAGLMASLRRYGEFGLRLAMGENRRQDLPGDARRVGHDRDHRLTGRDRPGTRGGHLSAETGIDIGSMMKNASIMLSQRRSCARDSLIVCHRISPRPHGNASGHLGGRDRDLPPPDRTTDQGTSVMRPLLKPAGARHRPVDLLPGAYAAGQSPSGAEILKRVDQNIAPGTKVSVGEMRIQERREVRTVRMKSWMRGLENLHRVSVAPRDKGTKMLKLDDQLWTYAPSTDRTILISGHMLRQSVMGSDLSYEDLLEDPALRRTMTLRSAGEDTIAGPVLLGPAPERKGGMLRTSRERSGWTGIDFVVMKEKRFARSGKLLKTTDVRNVVPIEGQWVAAEVCGERCAEDRGRDGIRRRTGPFDEADPRLLLHESDLAAVGTRMIGRESRPRSPI